MRFVSFSTNEIPKPHLGIVRDNEVLDVDLAGQALRLTVPDQMLDLIEHYEHYQPALQAILERTGSRRTSEQRRELRARVGQQHWAGRVQDSGVAANRQFSAATRPRTLARHAHPRTARTVPAGPVHRTPR